MGFLDSTASPLMDPPGIMLLQQHGQCAIDAESSEFLMIREDLF